MLLGRGLAPLPGNYSKATLSFANNVVSALTLIFTHTRQTYIHTQCFLTGRSYVCVELRTHAARRNFIIMEILLWRVTYRTRHKQCCWSLSFLDCYLVIVPFVSSTYFCCAHLHVFVVLLFECGQILPMSLLEMFNRPICSNLMLLLF